MVSLIVGVVSGLFGGLVGMGGGLVMIPLMNRFVGFTQRRAHGTSLVALVFTGIAGAISYGLHDAVDPVASGLLGITAIVMAPRGARFAHHLPEWKLKRAFGAFCLVVTALMLARSVLPAHMAPQAHTRMILLLATGAVTGFLSGMMGVGGGTIMVPAMVLLCGMDQHLAQGSSLLAMIPAGAVSAWTHKRLDNVDQRFTYGLVPGIVAGTLAGGALAHLLPGGALRVIFAVVVALSGLRSLRAGRPPAPAPVASGPAGGGAPSPAAR